jgi:hypothetical protein
LEDIEMSETVTRRDHAERVREFYRKQGAEREQQRIVNILQKLVDRKLTTTDSLVFEGLISIIKGDN